MQESIRTQIRDCILAGVNEDLGIDAVESIEWAAVDDTVAAVRRRESDLPGHAALVDWDTYRRVAL